MASTIFNVAKGRLNEFVKRVLNNDPATSGFVVALLQDTGLEAIATLRDYDTLAAILAGTNTEVSVASYARQVLTDTDIGDVTLDDTGDLQSWDTADIDFPALEAGQSVGAAVICYAPDTGGADSTLIPVHVTVPASPVALNGEIFHYRTPNGLWSSS